MSKQFIRKLSKREVILLNNFLNDGIEEKQIFDMANFSYVCQYFGFSEEEIRNMTKEDFSFDDEYFEFVIGDFVSLSEEEAFEEAMQMNSGFSECSIAVLLCAYSEMNEIFGEKSCKGCKHCLKCSFERAEHCFPSMCDFESNN